MRIKNLLAQFNQSSIGMKIGIIGVILIWLLPFVAIVGGLIFYYAEQTGQALEPKPGQTIPVIMLEPSTGSLGTLVTVKGEGWPAGSPVLVYLIPPDETTLPAYAITSVVADSAGRFTIGFVFPAEPRWESQATATVIVQTEAGRLSARASFSLVRPEAFVPETPSPTLEPAATAVVIETEEPTVTIEPTATPTLVAPTPTATPQPSPPSLTATTDLNIRSGPGLTYAIIGLLPAGQTANITGLSADGGWWQIEYSGVPTGRGWVSSRYVVVQNVSTVPILPAPPVLIIPPPAPTPTPVPTPTPAPIIVDWRGEYYPNRDLAGAPALVRNDVAVDFNWGFGSPAPGLPADDFSARWTRTWNFSEGTHRFHVAVDDGVRLYVDNALVIDSWQDGGRRELAAERWLWGGSHSLQIEYYEHLGEASVVAWAEKVSGAGPEADFDADPRSGRVPLRVEFDNDSSGDYDRCEWEFGDDHDSDDCDNPDHTYREAGNYTVRLKVWGPNDSDTRERDDYITVRPIANFAATPTSGPRPLVVNFTNLSTPYDRCEWAFGDGGVS
ncbi:MAG TPA: PA14 domain-containing protein, partial [Anaerolineae bacterium]|nr:PA14 domain-containing protein [Anaerolineae bacterium]